MSLVALNCVVNMSLYWSIFSLCSNMLETNKGMVCFGLYLVVKFWCCLAERTWWNIIVLHEDQESWSTQVHGVAQPTFRSALLPLNSFLKSFMTIPGGCSTNLLGDFQSNQVHNWNWKIHLLVIKYMRIYYCQFSKFIFTLT